MVYIISVFGVNVGLLRTQYSVVVRTRFGFWAWGYSQDYRLESRVRLALG